VPEAQRINTVDMIQIPGGTFRMGWDKHYPEEAPVHRVTVSNFLIDRTPVTNRQCRDFVKATGHATFAEIPPDPKDYPVARPDMIKGLDEHPVVHVAYSDAFLYARWAGMQLPTEAEWEFAARGELDGAEFAWGDEFIPNNRPIANTWHGDFPCQRKPSFRRTSPVTAFPPNGYGVHDMIGNVGEWTSDWFSPRQQADAPKECCIPENSREGSESDSYDSCQPNIKILCKVLKGGSHLCVPNYCRRYRPTARHAQPADTSTSHVRFRCVVRVRKDG